MANQEGFIDGLSEVALKEIREYNTEVLKLVGNIEKASKFTIGGKTPSESNNAVKQLTTQLQTQEKTISDLQAKYAQLAATQRNNITVTNSNTGAVGRNTTATRENSLANQILRTEQDRNYRANTLLGGAYARSSAQLLILKKNAKDYAIALGETHPKAVQAAKDASDLDARIKSADATVGDFQRNVGNYSNGVTKALGGAFSVIRQLAYLLPGIGIAGILGLLTEPIIEYVSKLELFKIKLSEVAIAKKELNKVSIEGEKNAQTELIALRANLEIAKDVTLTYKERSIAVDNLQKTYPFYFENLTKEKILAGETAAAEDALTEAILSRAKANAAVGKITENQSKIIDLEEERLVQVDQLTKAESRLAAARNRTNAASASEEGYQAEINALRSVRSQKSDIAKIDKEIAELTALNNRLTEYSIANQKKSIGLDYSPEKEKAIKLKREDAKAIEMQSSAYESLIKDIQDNISAVQKLQSATSRGYEEWTVYQKVIDQLQRVLKNLKEGQEELRTSAAKGTQELKDKNQAYLDQIKRMEELRAATEAYIASIANSSLGDLGMGSLQQFFDGTFARLFEGADTMKEKFAVAFTAIGEVAKETFAMINQQDALRYDAMFTRLQQQKEIAILFAGESATAREEIERQYEERRREIQRRQAESQKRAAVFNILINTAQGVVAALASVPPNVPLSIAIGVIGAIQAGVVASTAIPEFYKGTENAPEGWAWTQERGREIITDKSGKVKDTGSDGGRKLTYLKSGDKVKTAMQSKEIFEANMNRVLMNSGIMPVASEIRTNREQSAGIDYDKLAQTITNGFKSAPQPTTYALNVDERGFNTAIRNGATKTISMNAKLRGEPKKV